MLKKSKLSTYIPEKTDKVNQFPKPEKPHFEFSTDQCGRTIQNDETSSQLQVMCRNRNNGTPPL
jgi:hypothetical protein